MGACGVKVWIYQGEKLPGQPKFLSLALEGYLVRRSVVVTAMTHGGVQVMLAPKRIRHRKVQRGSMKGQAKG